MSHAAGNVIRTLDPRRDRAGVAAAFLDAADYILVERGTPMTPALADTLAADFFASAPPGSDPARSLRMGQVAPGGRIIGIAEVSFDYPMRGDAYLGLIILVPDARGGGQGRAFLRHLEILARNRGAARLFLAVLDANDAGRAFWRRMGFAVQTSLRPVTLGPRTQFACRMAKPLWPCARRPK